MPKHMCIVTGPAVGLRSTWFIKDMKKFAKKIGEKVQDFYLFDEILEQEGIEVSDAYQGAEKIGEILDGYQYQFKDLREKAYCSIGRKIDRLDDDVSAVVRIPTSVEWRGVMLEFKDHLAIANNLSPDRIVTLIDAEWKIQGRLEKHYGKHALQVIAHQKHLGIERILDWLASEVSVSEDWAEWCSHLTKKKVRHIVLGVKVPSPTQRTRYIRDVDNLTKLVTQPQVPVFYASYSMTVAEEKTRRMINELIWRLRRYGVVIDPASIEIGEEIRPADKDVVYAYTVCRDLRWDVQKVDIVVAFHPYTKAPPLSTGMMDELGHARAFRKERYLVLPEGLGSPFTKDNYVPAKHVFKEADDFFSYIEKERKPSLESRFSKYVDVLAKERTHRRKKG
jgi:hypothetical protein